MEDDDTSGPLTEAAAVVDDAAPEAFSLLGDDIRLAILLALWEADERIDPVAGTTVPFSELRAAVGVSDSGRFNYHLDKLAGRFVESTDIGYRLLPAGNTIVRAIVSTAGFGDAETEPLELDDPCWFCGAPTALVYRNQRLYHVCTDCEGNFELSADHPTGVLSAWIADPTILEDRDPVDLYTAANVKAHLEYAKRYRGICSECAGPVDQHLGICGDHDTDSARICETCGRSFEVAVRTVCPVCKHAAVRSIHGHVQHHPAMQAFAWELGYDLHDRDHETIRWLGELNDAARITVDRVSPPRVRLAYRSGGEAIEFVYDGGVDSVSVDRP